MKDFQKWHNLKKDLHEKDRIVYFREKQIWWCILGLNIGYEQDGKNKYFLRPVLILKKFNPKVLWILPITTSGKNGKYYYQYEYDNKKYSIILSQIRLISSKRLLRKIRILSKEDFEKTKKKFIKLL